MLTFSLSFLPGGFSEGSGLERSVWLKKARSICSRDRSSSSASWGLFLLLLLMLLLLLLLLLLDKLKGIFKYQLACDYCGTTTFQMLKQLGSTKSPSYVFKQHFIFLLRDHCKQVRKLFGTWDTTAAQHHQVTWNNPIPKLYQHNQVKLYFGTNCDIFDGGMALMHWQNRKTSTLEILLRHHIT